MAIVKIKYTRTPKAAKANVRYIENRRGKDKEKITRTLWNGDGRMTRQEAYQMIDRAEKGSIFFKIIINPDVKTEDTKRDLSLYEITERTMAALQDHIPTPIQYVATLHDDHTPLRHVHILAVVKGGIYQKEREAMHQMATQAALEQRRERDLILEQREQTQQKEKEAEWEYSY